MESECTMFLMEYDIVEFCLVFKSNMHNNTYRIFILFRGIVPYLKYMCIYNLISIDILRIYAYI